MYIVVVHRNKIFSKGHVSQGGFTVSESEEKAQGLDELYFSTENHHISGGGFVLVTLLSLVTLWKF